MPEGKITFEFCAEEIFNALKTLPKKESSIDFMYEGDGVFVQVGKKRIYALDCGPGTLVYSNPWHELIPRVFFVNAKGATSIYVTISDEYIHLRAAVKAVLQ